MLASLKHWLADRLGLLRIDAAITHLIARDLNLNCALFEGPEGNRILRDAFLDLIPVLQPTVFCDIGAHDGSTARAVRDLAPECAVYAFEANPHIYARHSKTMVELGIEWLNVAVADKTGHLPVFAPRTLTRAYVDGRVQPADIMEGDDTGKTSLLMRNEEATYDQFVVEARTLDDLFRDRLSDAREHRFFLWIDVEGAADRVLAGANEVLRRTQAVFIEAENHDFWRDQKRSGEILNLLYRKGFVSVARDKEYGDLQFNMIFVNVHATSALAPALFDASSKLRACLKPASRDLTSARAPAARFASIRGWLQAEIPVLVPCFNNPTYTRGMLRQLRALGFQQVVLVDNASTSPDMRTWLDGLEDEATVIALPDNFGPHNIFNDPRNFALLPRRFCITDPDLSFNPALPEGFLGDLSGLIERHRVGKAGFALDISDRELIRDELFRIGEKDWKIWEWEAQFWDKPLEPLANGDAVYDADIDTTFALYDKSHFDPGNHLRAVRVAGRFTARHLPWYWDRGLPEAEAALYGRTEKVSYYLKERKPATGERGSN
jgi:FkbM family methyltransferase